MRLILFFDLEATGKNSKVDEVIQFSGILYDLDDDKIVYYFDHYCWTPMAIDYGATLVHGINKLKLMKMSNGRSLPSYLFKELNLLTTHPITFSTFNTAYDLNIFNTTLLKHGHDPLDFGMELNYFSVEKLGTLRSNFCVMKYFNKHPGFPRSGKLVDYTSYSGLKISEIREDFKRDFPNSEAKDHSALFDSYLLLRAFRKVYVEDGVSGVKQ